MVNNASARQFRIWVNLPNEGEEAGLEVTNYCSGDGFLTLNCNPIDEGGIFQLTGQLVLDIPQYDPLFDIWENPTRWQPGNYVFIKVADSTGTLRRCPINRLYILKLPTQPAPGSWSIEVELGDAFTLYDSKTPTQVSSITQTRRSALDQMLGQIGLEMEGSIYNVDTGLFSFSTKETIAKQAGELAIGGFSGLYQDSHGKVRSIRLNFTPEWRLYKHVVGVDDAEDFKPIASEARTPEEVTVVSEVVRSANSGSNTEARYRGATFYRTPMSIAAIDGSTNATAITAIQGVRRWNWISSHRYSQTVDEQRVRGLVVPESLYLALIAQGRDLSYPGELVMVNAMNSEESKVYEGGSEGRLLRSEATIYKCLGEVLAEFYKKNLLPSSSLPGFLDKIVAEEITIEYSYKNDTGEDSKGQTRKITYTKKEPLGIVASAANDWIGQGAGGPVLTANPTTLIVSEVREQSWNKRSDEEWEYTDDHYKAGQVRSGTIKAFRQLIKIEVPGGSVQNSRSGDLQPPAAERRPAKEELNRPSNSTKTITASARLNRAKNRSRKLKMKNLSETGASTVAELLTKLDGYREQGWRITTPFRDEWLAWFKPFLRIDLDYNGRVYYGIVDNVVFAFSGNSAIVTADCMKVGKSTEAATVDTYPYLSLPSFTTEPTPDPFGTIPIGQGDYSDPVPPAEDDPTPEIAFTEPIVPTVDVVKPIVAESSSTMIFNEVAYDVAPSPPVNVVVLSDSTMDFTAVVDPPPAGLVGEWLLDTSSWTDTAGSNDLIEVGDGANLVFDSSISANCAEFGGAGFDSNTDYLEITDLAFSTRTATQNWSWELTFDYWIDTSVSGLVTGDAYLIRLVNQWEITFEFAVPFIQFLDGGQVAALFLTNADFPPEQGEWHSVVFEYDASTVTLTGSIDGVPDLFTSTCPVLSNVTPGPLQIGYKAPGPTRIRNVRYYLTDLVDNP